MKKITFALFILGFGAGLASAASPIYTLETAPYSNETAGVVTTATAAVFGVSVSTSVLTRVDLALNTAFAAALGANYQRAEIGVQNQTSGDFYCTYSATQAITTKTNFWKIGAGAMWPFKLGKGLPLYCFYDSTAAGILTVGGIAWK